MQKYSEKTSPWYSYSNLIHKIMISENVTTIGSHAFYECHWLTSIDLPDSITSIGDSAFDCCLRLESITIPEGVTSIGEYAFRGCSSLTSITIPENVICIEKDTFGGCSSLTSITIPEGVTTIGIKAFSGCSSLRSITIPNSVTYIGEQAFDFCYNIERINVQEDNLHYGFDGNCLITSDGYLLVGFKNCVIPTDGKVTRIMSWAFHSNDSLTSIVIPSSVTHIGNYTFVDCKNLTTINFEGTIEQWSAVTGDRRWISHTLVTHVHCIDGDVAL